jgi:hypothetical protein
MTWLTLTAIWLALQLPLGGVVGRLLRASNPGGSDEVAQALKGERKSAMPVTMPLRLELDAWARAG